MTPSLQYAESVKYLARPLALIPVEGGFEVFAAWGVQREYIGHFSSAELANFLKSDFARQQSQNAKIRARECVRRTPTINLDLGLDLNLDI